MEKSLIIVDYQKDFVDKDGALSVGVFAQNIYPKIKAIAENYDEKHIYFTLDSHQENDWEEKITPEAKIFKPHCIVGTPGHAIYGDIKGKNNIDNHVNKQAYCPDQDFLMKAVSTYGEITVVGVVTDICVFQTVIGLYTTAVNNNFNIQIVVDSSACASFDADREKWALDYLENVLSIRII